MSSVMFYIGKALIFPFISVVFPTERFGYKEEKSDMPTVVVSNHLSNLDVFSIGRCFKGKTYYLCKKEVFKNKLGAYFVKGMGGVKIDREKPELGEIKECLKLLKEKKRLMIFPEGTRNKKNDGELLGFKGGAGLFAFKAKARIIPMFIDKKSRFFKKNHIYIGNPFTLEEFYGEKFNQELSEKINDKIKEHILLCKAKLEEALNERMLLKGKRHGEKLLIESSKDIDKNNDNNK